MGAPGRAPSLDRNVPEGFREEEVKESCEKCTGHGKCGGDVKHTLHP